MVHGLYRVHGVGGRPDDVRMEDDGIEMPLAESLYRSRGHLPPVDLLPWQEDYFGTGSSPDPDNLSGAGGTADKTAREQARHAFLARFQKP